jgi:glycosyltransferase involved in cell wall biosynthesis
MIAQSGISVIIAVRNSAGMLDACLGALSKSTLAPLECLVVDDASTDDTPSVAERHSARVIVLDQRSGPARARNLGALQARGDVLLFVDADVCLHDDAIARITDHLRQDLSLDAVIGAYDDAPAAAPFVSQYRNLLHCFTHRAGRREASTFWSGCGAVRKEVFLRHGGFDLRYGRPAIEDVEFGMRLTSAGGRVLLDPAIQAQHRKCWTFAGMLKTDFFDRAIPWTIMSLRARSMPADLAVRSSQRLSVLLTFLMIAMMLVGSATAAIVCTLFFFVLNRPFYAFLSARRGILFALRAVPLHLLFYFYCGVGFLLGVALHLVSMKDGSLSQVPGEETP